jgi:predicted transcriptional regulator of viral defense system
MRFAFKDVMMKHDEFFRKNPVFTGEDMAKHISLQGKSGGRTQEALLAYHQRTGQIIRIRRGLYAVIPRGASKDLFTVDPYLIASRLASDAVLSHHTALEFHGRAYSLFTHITYSASRPLGSISFQSHVFRGTKFPKDLESQGKTQTGVLIAEHAGISLRVSSLERALVETLDRPDLSGSWEEIWRSLESIEFFNLDKVLAYTLLLKNATTAAKVGFFLEQHQAQFMVEDRYLKMLHDIRPRQAHYLDRSKRKTGRLVKKWNLVVPVEVLERTWGEVI